MGRDRRFGAGFWVSRKGVKPAKNAPWVGGLGAHTTVGEDAGGAVGGSGGRERVGGVWLAAEGFDGIAPVAVTEVDGIDGLRADVFGELGGGDLVFAEAGAEGVEEIGTGGGAFGGDAVAEFGENDV